MASYRVEGKHRGLLSGAGVLQGRVVYHLESLSQPPETCQDDTAPYARTEVRGTCPWGQWRVEPYLWNTGSTSGDLHRAGLRIRVETIWGEWQEKLLYVTVRPTPGATPTGDGGCIVTVVWAGQVEYQARLQTVLGVSEQSTAQGIVDYAGPPFVDTPPQMDVSVYERYAPGERAKIELQVTADFTILRDGDAGNWSTQIGQLALVETLVNTGEAISGYSIGSFVTAAARNQSFTASQNHTLWMGASRPTVTRVATVGAASCTATIGGRSASVQVVAPSPCLTASGEAEMGVSPDRPVRLRGVVRRFDAALSGVTVDVWNGSGYDMVVTGGDGTWGKDYTQRKYTGRLLARAGNAFTGQSVEQTHQDGVDEWQGVYARLRPEDLPARGLTAQDWRHMARLFPPYTAFLLHQRPYRTLSSGFVDTSSGSTVARSLSSSHGTDPDLDGAQWDGYALHGYAFLEIRGDCSVATPFRVRIGNRIWDRDWQGNALQWTLSTATWRIDLLHPSNTAVEVSGKSSRWPFVQRTPLRVEDDFLWGVCHATQVEILDLPASGRTLSIDWIRIVRDGDTRITVLSPRRSWVEDVTGDAQQEYLRTLLRGETDGAVGLEAIAAYREISTGNITHRTLYDVGRDCNGDANAPEDASASHPACGYVATRPSWDFTECSPPSPEIPPLSPCYLNDLRYAIWLEGGGMVWNDAVGEWEMCSGRVQNTATAMRAQMLGDRLITWIPDIDAFAAASRSVTEWRCASLVYGRAYGVVHGATGRGSGVTVQVGPAGSHGVGVTDARGLYGSGVPFVEGDAQQLVTALLASPPYPSYTHLFRNACEHRVAFRRGEVQETPDHACVTDWSEGGALFLGWQRRVIGYTGPDLLPFYESGPYAGVDLWYRMRMFPRAHALYLLGRSGSAGNYTWRLCVTQNQGGACHEVWSMAARSAVVEVLRDHGVLVLLRENESAVQMQYSTDGGETWSTAVACEYRAGSGPWQALTGVLLDSAYDDRKSGELYLLVRQSGGEVWHLVSHDWGHRWVRVQVF